MGAGRRWRSRRASLHHAVEAIEPQLQGTVGRGALHLLRSSALFLLGCAGRLRCLQLRQSLRGVENLSPLRLSPIDMRDGLDPIPEGLGLGDRITIEGPRLQLELRFLAAELRDLLQVSLRVLAAAFPGESLPQVFRNS